MKDKFKRVERELREAKAELEEKEVNLKYLYDRCDEFKYKAQKLEEELKEVKSGKVRLAKEALSFVEEKDNFQIDQNLIKEKDEEIKRIKEAVKNYLRAPLKPKILKEMHHNIFRETGIDYDLNKEIGIQDEDIKRIREETEREYLNEKKNGEPWRKFDNTYEGTFDIPRGY